jgi:peptidoglycan/xylan/chitin deacetylase (PgdA/CDA1 family)
MYLPPHINNAYLYARKYYLNIFGKFATPQYGVHILNGHYIDVNNDVSNDIFFDTLNKLSKEVDFVSFQEGSALIHSKKIPTTEKLLCFSFDDGFEECFTKIKPVLDAFNIKAGFFVCPNFVDAKPDYIDDFLKKQVFLKTEKLPMSWAQIKSLHAEGHLIGSHTLNHIDCVKTSKAVIAYELKESKRIIEAQLQAECAHFAYTYGKIEGFSKEMLARAEQHYTYIYSQAGTRDYFTFDGRVINRRHFEANWRTDHIVYYLSKNKLLLNADLSKSVDKRLFADVNASESFERT